MIREQNLPSLRPVFFASYFVRMHVLLSLYYYIIVSTVVEIDVRDRNRSLSNKITETSLSYYIPARETLVFYRFFSSFLPYPSSYRIFTDSTYKNTRVYVP